VPIYGFASGSSSSLIYLRKVHSSFTSFNLLSLSVYRIGEHYRINKIMKVPTKNVYIDGIMKIKLEALIGAPFLSALMCVKASVLILLSVRQILSFNTTQSSILTRP